MVMTIWHPALEPAGPRYLALANAIEADIERGRLAPGAQLPTQRYLADALS